MYYRNFTTLSHQEYLIDDLTGEELADFWSRITVDRESGCWLWRDSEGDANCQHGRFTYRGRTEDAYRVSFVVFHHPVMRGVWPVYVIDQVCGVRRCCNPMHLEHVILSVGAYRWKRRADPTLPVKWESSWKVREVKEGQCVKCKKTAKLISMSHKSGLRWCRACWGKLPPPMKLVCNLMSSQRRAERYGLTDGHGVIPVQWAEMLLASQGICAYCRRDVGLDMLTIDHKIPISRGGRHSIENLAACCHWCNSQKSNQNDWK